MENIKIVSWKPYLIKAKNKRSSNLIITCHYIWKQEWQDRLIVNILWNAGVFSK